MKTPTSLQLNNSEHQVVEIMRKLPPEQSSQVVAFARFVAYQTFQPHMLDFLDRNELSEEQLTKDDTKWEALLASDEAQTVLEQLADDALLEIRAGKAKSISFTAEGEIAPG